MVEFTSLVQPQEFTVELALVVVFLFGMIMQAGIRLRSPFVLFVFTLTVITFILTFIGNLAFLWFWIMIVVCMITIVISSVVQFAM